MSGPKGFSYRVVSAAELERRAVADTRGRCTELEARRRVLDARAKKLGLSAMPRRVAPRHGRLTTWTAYENALQSDLGQQHTLVDRARQQLHTQEINSRLAQSSRPVTLGIATPLTSKPNAASVVERALASAVASIARVEDDTVRDKLTARAGEAAALGQRGAPADGVLALLRAEVQAELRNQQTRHRLQLRVDELDLRLAALPGDEATVLRQYLSSCTTVSEVEMIEQQAEELTVRSTAEQDRRFVISQATSVLENLGYVVGEDFAPATAEGRSGVVQPPDLPEHRLKITFLPGGDRFLTNVVAVTGAADRHADIAAETITCAHLDAAQRDLEAIGIVTTRFHAVPAGVVPLEHLTAAPTDTTAPAAAVRRGRSTTETGREA